MRVLAFFLAITGTQVSALSCMQQSIPMLYSEVAGSEAAYLPVLGGFTFDRPANEVTQSEGMVSMPSGQTFMAVFEGKALNPNGFYTDFETAVEVTEGCIATWCGGIDQSTEYMAMLKQSVAGGYELAVGPCPGHVWRTPSADDVAAFVQCHKSGGC